MDKDIVIVVENGRVSEVYCSDGEFTATVIDMDTDSPEREADIQESLRSLQEAVQEDRLISVI